MLSLGFYLFNLGRWTTKSRVEGWGNFHERNLPLLVILCLKSSALFRVATKHSQLGFWCIFLFRVVSRLARVVHFVPSLSKCFVCNGKLGAFDIFFLDIYFFFMSLLFKVRLKKENREKRKKFGIVRMEK